VAKKGRSEEAPTGVVGVSKAPEAARRRAEKRLGQARLND